MSIFETYQALSGYLEKLVPASRCHNYKTIVGKKAPNPPKTEYICVRNREANQNLRFSSIKMNSGAIAPNPGVND